jgi:DNA polymerase-3 subunit delta'
VPRAGRLTTLVAWSHELARVARHDDHPWNEGLLMESLVQQGATALQPAAGRTASPVQRLDTLPG